MRRSVSIYSSTNACQEVDKRLQTVGWLAGLFIRVPYEADPKKKTGQRIEN